MWHLAEAGYANLIDPITGLIYDSSTDLINALKGEKLSPTQAEEFVKNWQVVDQSSDVKYGSSGFSATLFYNANTGEYLFANRAIALN